MPFVYFDEQTFEPSFFDDCGDDDLLPQIENILVDKDETSTHHIPPVVVTPKKEDRDSKKKRRGRPAQGKSKGDKGRDQLLHLCHFKD